MIIHTRFVSVKPTPWLKKGGISYIFREEKPWGIFFNCSSKLIAAI